MESRELKRIIKIPFMSEKDIQIASKTCRQIKRNYNNLPLLQNLSQKYLMHLSIAADIITPALYFGQSEYLGEYVAKYNIITVDLDKHRKVNQPFKEYLITLTHEWLHHWEVLNNSEWELTETFNKETDIKLDSCDGIRFEKRLNYILSLMEY